MAHPFEEGKTYRNRAGEYVVQSIEGNRMTIRYVGGGTLVTSVAIQARIWENIQFEKQLSRAEERQRQAREARAAARKRSKRARRARVAPTFDGFQEGDFESKKRGIAWGTRKELGKMLTHELSQRVEGTVNHWIVPYQSEVHVAREGHYDTETRETNAALYVAVDPEAVSYGFCVGKPKGRVLKRWPWTKLVTGLAGDEKLRDLLHSVLEGSGLSLDVYAMDVSFGQVGTVTVKDKGFLWQHEDAEQEVTREMSGEELAEYLSSVAGTKQAKLCVRTQIPAAKALKAGGTVSGQIVDAFQALMPLYDASEGV
jgi:hypothetical protein